MSNRFVDTEIWGKGWYCSLSPTYKLMWKYLCDNCNNAGIWSVNFALVQFQLWDKSPLDPANFGVREDGTPRVIPIAGGTKWFMPGFVLFQQSIKSLADLNPDIGYHKQIIRLLDIEGINYLKCSDIIVKASIKTTSTLPKPSREGLGIGIGINKVKDRGVGKGNPEPPGFAPVWDRYPRKEGRKDALKAFIDTVNTDDDLQDINKALDNYLEFLAINKTEPKYFKMGSTWFNNWQEWLVFKQPIKQTVDMEE